MRWISFLLTLALAVQGKPNPEPAGRASEDPQAIIQRLRHGWIAAEGRLDGKDPGAETQKLQKRIIEDLDKLLDPPNQERGDPSASDSSNSSSAVGRSQSRSRSSRQSNGKQVEAGANGDTEGENGRDRRNGDGMRIDKKDPNKEPVVTDRSDAAWVLPARKRQEMDAYSRDAKLPKYEQIIDRYYQTIAEQTKRREQE